MTDSRMICGYILLVGTVGLAIIMVLQKQAADSNVLHEILGGLIAMDASFVHWAFKDRP